MHFLSALSLACLLSPLVARAQATSAADSLTAAIRALAGPDSPLPGFAVAVVDSAGIRYEAGFGFADRIDRLAFTPATVQEIGSVSKTLIGVALLKAQELGLLSLETEINAILPYPVVNPHGYYRPIRVVDLATHTAGLLDREKPYLATYRWFPKGAAYSFESASAAPGRYAPTAMAAWLRAYLTPGGRHYAPGNFAAAAPGAAYHYSNIGAALAAHLIEIRSGVSYAAFTRRYILEPAQMTSAGWTITEVAASPHATGYSAKGKPYRPYFGLTYPDGGLHASTRDLAGYLRHVIRGSQGGRDALLTAASYQELLRSRFSAEALPTGVPAREPDSGIFWARRASGEIGHTGSDPGIFSACFFDPRTGIGRVFMTNIDIDESPAAAARFKVIWQALRQYGGRLKAGQ